MGDYDGPSWLRLRFLVFCSGTNLSIESEFFVYKCFSLCIIGLNFKSAGRSRGRFLCVARNTFRF